MAEVLVHKEEVFNIVGCGFEALNHEFTLIHTNEDEDLVEEPTKINCKELALVKISVYSW